VDHRAVTFVGFLVARCNSAEFLEFAKEVFDQMSPFVHLEVAFEDALSIGLGRNDGDGTSAVEFGAQPIVVKSLVGEQGVERDIRNQRFDADAVMSLARQQDEAREIAERIDKREYLGRQAAARSANRLILSPPLAPAPCWWTRTIVPSIMAYSKSGSPDNSLNRLSKTPFVAQRRNRRKIEFQSPKSGCKSRQGEPVRAIQRTASRKPRLLSPLRPGSPGLPGRSGAIRSHCVSLKTLRIKARLLFRALNQNSKVMGIHP
jgi:hypothetical protein